MTQVFLLTAGSNQTYTSDKTWNNANNSVFCLGAGGSGGAYQKSASAIATGGGGGAYTLQANVQIATPGTTTVTYRVGSGGTAVNGAALNTAGGVNGNAGGDSWWNDTAYPTTGSDKVGAKGGSPGGQGTAATINGGAGGASASAYPASPTAAFSGGRGGNATGTSTATGGGGAAGMAGTGGQGTDGAANAGTKGGDCGDGLATGGSGNTAGNGTSGNPGTGYGGGYRYDTGAAATPGCGGAGGGGRNTVNGTVTGGSGGAYGAGGAGAVNYRTTNGASLLATSGAGAQGIIALRWVPSFNTFEWIEAQPYERFWFIPNIASPEPSGTARPPVPTFYPDKWLRPLSEPVRDRRQHPTATWAPSFFWGVYAPVGPATYNVSVTETASAADTSSAAHRKSTLDWHQPLGQPVYPKAYRHTLPSTFFVSPRTYAASVAETANALETQSSTVRAALDWHQPLGQPVYPKAYRHTLPSTFFVSPRTFSANVAETASATDSQDGSIVGLNVNWHQPFSQPQFGPFTVIGGVEPYAQIATSNDVTRSEAASATDSQTATLVISATVAEAASATDSQSSELFGSGISWVQPFSQPYVVSSFIASSSDQSGNGAEAAPAPPFDPALLSWVQPLSQPVLLPRRLHPNGWFVRPDQLLVSVSGSVAETASATATQAATLVAAAVVAEGGDGYIVDESGNYVVDESGNYLVTGPDFARETQSATVQPFGNIKDWFRPLSEPLFGPFTVIGGAEPYERVSQSLDLSVAETAAASDAQSAQGVFGVIVIEQCSATASALVEHIRAPGTGGEGGGCGQPVGKPGKKPGGWREKYDHLPKYAPVYVDREPTFDDLVAEELDRIARQQDEEETILAILLSEL